MPYAHDNRISHDPIAGGVKITEAQYTAAIEGMLNGLVVSIANGFELVVPKTDEDKFPPADKTIEELKVDKNNSINAARLALNLGGFAHAGKVFASDQLSRSDIDGVANHIALFGTFPPEFPGGWKAVDNTVLLMPTIDDFKAFYQSMTAQGAANFIKAQALKAQLSAATTPEEIAAINW